MTTQRPRASRLQFSLRALLAVLTLIAIGGWWWQKRFRVESTLHNPKAAGRSAQFAGATQIASKRRQGLDNVVLDGPTTVVTRQGTLILEEDWRQGVRHGIYRRRDSDGNLLFECEFRHGRLVRIGDKAVADFLHAATIDDLAGPLILQELERDTSLDFMDQPLEDVVIYLQFTHGLPIIIDRRALESAGIAPGQPVTDTIAGVPLFVALVELLSPLDLAIAYHYEVLWVTTPDSELHEETMQSDLRLDTASPALRDALDGPASFDYLDQPLAEVLADISFRYRLAVESDLQFPVEHVNLGIRGIKLHSALGMLSYMHDLRYEVSGDQLLVTQVPGKLPRPKSRKTY